MPHRVRGAQLRVAADGGDNFTIFVRPEDVIVSRTRPTDGINVLEGVITELVSWERCLIVISLSDRRSCARGSTPRPHLRAMTRCSCKPAPLTRFSLRAETGYETASGRVGRLPCGPEILVLPVPAIHAGSGESRAIAGSAAAGLP